MARYGNDHAPLRILLGTLFVISCVTFLALLLVHGGSGWFLPLVVGTVLFIQQCMKK